MRIQCMDGCKIGIMGGSFDPIHYGHLVLAEQARTRFNLDRIVFIPVGKAPHKSIDKMTEARDRLAMTLLATSTNEQFEVSSMEIDREIVTYSIDTVREFKKTFRPEDKIYFITGADAILDLEKWKDFEALCKECIFIGATRPGFDLHRVTEEIMRLNKAHGAEIHLLTVPALAISSTDIRNRVSRHKSIRYLLPESVEDYIMKKGLYR